ncbi:family 16 glycoside hydrolase [Mucilaginibacter ximonensis]|uniref:Family 16 glycoside hydrolase n=1 Tax=Mucilaginibacter ximonensis TaxID=538021 RepID=A0ABW5YA63_9SPHI
MKKIYLLSIITLFQTVGFAQDKVAAVLSKMPAYNAASFNKDMAGVAELSEDELVTLINGLKAPGTPSNAAIQYAVGGFTAYATQSGNEKLRTMAVAAYIKALPLLTDEQSRQFIISQFDLVGKDDAVACLKAYLTDNDLADAASRALVKINSPASKSALLAALTKAKGAARLSVIEALGNARYKAAAKPINLLAKTNDAAQAKVCYYALSQIADPSSETVLAAAAAKSGYKYENTNATKSYLVYAEQLLRGGNKLAAQKIATVLIAKLKAPELINVRINALKLLVEASANKQTLLLAAAADANPQYRAAALRYALPYLNAANVSLWTKKLATVNDDVKIDILYMLGQTSIKAALPAILAQGKSKNATVRSTAINAAVNIGQSQVLGDLIKLMESSDSDGVDVIVDAINRMKGAGITQQVAAAIPNAKESVQVALIGILDSRAATDQFKAVYAQLTSENSRTRSAAFSALRRVSDKNNTAQLYTLLNGTTNSDDEEAVQNALISIINGDDNKTQQTDFALKQMASAPENKKSAYYKVLASLGGDKALKTVTEAYDAGNADTKKAVLAALSGWVNGGASHELIKIARREKDTDLSKYAIGAYLYTIAQNNYTPEQHLLMLREAMDATKEIEQRKKIMRSVEQAKCFDAIIFAGKYLDDADLKQEAATSLIKVTLAGEYDGDMIKDLLNKAKPLVNNRQQQAVDKYIAAMKPSEGFVSMFNGTDLTGWKGLVADPIKRAKMDAKTLAAAQQKADAEAKVDWKPVNGELLFEGKGFQNLCTVKKYGNFEMYVDWKIIDDHKGQGDAGIYLRGSPQVQIWDTTRHSVGAQVGSGGLYNNQVNESKPLKVADNKLDEWNTFHIIMKDDRVTVYLNGQLVTDNVILENYWDRKQPIFPIEQIELQAHGSPVAYRDLYIKELPQTKPFELSDEEKKDGFKVLFDGTNMFNWIGNTVDYTTEDGNIVIHPRPGKGNGGNLYTKQEYSDFVFRFEFKLTPGANNGLGIRAPLEGDAAYTGMELQILDNEAPQYKDLHVYQYHGSVYGTIPAKRGFLKPVGEWNYEEVIVKGPKIKVILNGTLINDADITDARKNGAADGKPHPGLQRESGHIGFLGHGDVVYFRNIRVKELK